MRKRFKEIQTDHKALEKKIDAGLLEIAALAKEQSTSSAGNGGTISNTSEKDDEEEKKARLAPKPKPKFDPKTGKWVVPSWDGSVAGVEDGEKRSFEDLNAPSMAALAINVGGSRSGGGDVVMGNSSSGTGSDVIQQQASIEQQQRGVSFQQEEGSTTPFAIIDEVSPDSPASEAGLLVNDLIIRFGNVNSRNHCDFRAIAELVPKVAGESGVIKVAVRRKTLELGGAVELIKTEVVELRPRPWAGRGMLGCHIVPYNGE